MASAVILRSQIEAALADRIPAALTPAPRTLRPVLPTGIAAVDHATGGGLPLGAVTEMIGPECSGRTGLALVFLAQLMQQGKVCAWVDASDALSPESAAACGVDLARLLWVRCGAAQTTAVTSIASPTAQDSRFAVPKKYFIAKPAVKGLHGGGMGGHPRGEARGMDTAVSGLLHPAKATEKPAGGTMGFRPLQKPDFAMPQPYSAAAKAIPARPAKPWGRLEQALKAADLLLAAGGFGAVVLDMAGIAPEQVSRIPLATWFRYRAAAERTQSSVLLLTQYASAKSAAGLVVHLEAGAPISEGNTVLAAFERRIQVARQRFAPSHDNVIAMRKPPQRAGAGQWQSPAAWAAPAGRRSAG